MDLKGLPPTPDDIEAFAKDPSPRARSLVVDKLLASPQYGERWGRHFMDIWRYCDWYGLGAQLRHSQKHLWHWRDWIVESLNADKGYDRMLVQMLAADEEAPEDRENLRATGFLARSYYLFNRTTWLDDTIEHTCRAFLGMTMQCVKCHSHKYDPIEQQEYYNLRAIFEPIHVRLDPWRGETDLEKNGLPRVFDLHLDTPTYRHVRGDEMNPDKSKALQPGVPAVLSFAAFQPQPIKLPQTAAQPALLPFVFEDQIRDAEAKITIAHKAGAKTSLVAEKESVVATKRLAMVRAVFVAEGHKGDKPLAHAAATAEAAYDLARAELDLAVAEGDDKAKDAKKKRQVAADALEKARKKLANPGEVYSPVRVSLKAQEGPEEANNATVQSYPEISSGRRLEFARWMTDKRNPLTARVLVNHVWLRHFGSSLTADVGDFGLRCPPPLHQDILDSLAVEFMNGGWSLKRLHRTLVLSELYSRSSSNAGANEATLKADPENTCYWRMNSRRLESQVVRDCLLQLGGKLDLTLGGPSIDPDKSEASHRRSLYFLQNADVEHRFLAAFDNSNVLECYRRNESIVPQQALALTNSHLSSECSEAMAAAMPQGDKDAFVREAFLTILGRSPSSVELATSREGLMALGNSRALFLQALFSHNDFVTLR